MFKSTCCQFKKIYIYQPDYLFEVLPPFPEAHFIRVHAFAHEGARIIGLVSTYHSYPWQFPTGRSSYEHCSDRCGASTAQHTEYPYTLIPSSSIVAAIALHSFCKLNSLYCRKGSGRVIKHNEAESCFVMKRECRNPFDRMDTVGVMNELMFLSPFSSPKLEQMARITPPNSRSERGFLAFHFWNYSSRNQA